MLPETNAIHSWWMFPFGRLTWNSYFKVNQKLESLKFDYSFWTNPMDPTKVNGLPSTLTSLALGSVLVKDYVSPEDLVAVLPKGLTCLQFGGSYTYNIRMALNHPNRYNLKSLIFGDNFDNNRE